MEKLAQQQGTRGLRQLAGGWHRFWHWWTDTLLGMLPGSLRSLAEGSSSILLIECDGNQCTARYGSRGSLKKIVEFGLEEPGSAASQLGSYNRKASSIVLLVPTGLFLRNSITLPAAARPRLHDVLGFEMDRHTPFTREQVYYGYQQQPQPGNPNQIAVTLSVILRDTLDPVLSHLRALGVRPTHAASLDDSIPDILSGMNVLPETIGTEASLRHRRRKQWKVAIVLALLAAAFILPAKLREQRLEMLSTEMAAPQLRAEEAQAVNEQISSILEGRRFLISAKNETPTSLVVLNELTNLLPDNTWLVRFEHEKGEVKFQGESTNASALIGMLEQSAYLTDARFFSPLTVNPRTQKERFVIVATIKKGGGNE